MFRIPRWSKISVEMYQYINELNETEMEEEDKIILTISMLTGKSEQQINKLRQSLFGEWRFNYLLYLLRDRLAVLTKKKEPVKRVKGFKFIPNIEQLTFGKYIEIQHFFKQGHVKSLHLVAASMCENEDIEHKVRAAQILQLPFLPIFWNVVDMLEQLNKFNREYKGLLGIDEEVDDDDMKPEQSKFNEKYGWIYSAKKVADFEGIPLAQAFDLPIRQAFNDLSYLKELANYEYELNKRQLGSI